MTLQNNSAENQHFNDEVSTASHLNSNNTTDNRTTNNIIHVSDDIFVLPASGIQLKNAGDNAYFVEYEDIKLIDISQLPENIIFLMNNNTLNERFRYDEYLLFQKKWGRVCLSFSEGDPKDVGEINMSPYLYYYLRSELPQKYSGIFLKQQIEHCEDCGSITVMNHVQVIEKNLANALQKVNNTFVLIDRELDKLDNKLEIYCRKKLKI